MDINRTINIAAYAGKILLESGAEIYRVEETITRICNSCGILKVDAYVTINVIIISAESNYSETVSLIKRVKRSSQNLEKISRVNNISRHIKDSGYTLEDIYKKLQKIDSLKTYSYKLNIFSSGGASGFFLSCIWWQYKRLCYFIYYRLLNKISIFNFKLSAGK
jgi:uncharacterized membrane protein YjjP (DUF1212 family)